MKYTERFTRKCDTTFIFYTSEKDSTDICNRLGFYEDMGLSPVEMADALIQAEMMKPFSERNMDNVEKWVSAKRNYYEYEQQRRKLNNDFFVI